MVQGQAMIARAKQTKAAEKAATAAAAKTAKEAEKLAAKKLKVEANVKRACENSAGKPKAKRQLTLSETRLPSDAKSSAEPEATEQLVTAVEEMISTPTEDKPEDKDDKEDKKEGESEDEEDKPAEERSAWLKLTKKTAFSKEMDLLIAGWKKPEQTPETVQDDIYRTYMPALQWGRPWK